MLIRYARHITAKIPSRERAVGWDPYHIGGKRAMGDKVCSARGQSSGGGFFDQIDEIARGVEVCRASEG
jgi:hypothetical protein